MEDDVPPGLSGPAAAPADTVPSDHSLVRRFRSGQPDAATELYRRYGDRLRALVAGQVAPELHRLTEQTGRYDEGARAAVRAAGQRGKFKPNFVAAVDTLFTEATPARLVQAIGSNFKRLGGLVGTLEDAINNTLPLGELVDIATRFKGGTRHFHEMVSGLLARVRGGLFHENEGDAVNLLTYFRAKGRQWHTVMIPGANQKVIPHARSSVEDERRLFYVAVTRATHSLTLSYVRQAVQSLVEPSQFLAEMGVARAEEKRAGAIS